MSKTIQEAFQEAVLAGAKDDASVLVKYGVNLGAAVSAFTGARNFDAVKAVVDLGGDATNGIHSILFGKGAGLAHIKRLINLGAKPTMKHLEWAIMNDRVREAKLMIENSDIDMSKSRLLKTHGLSEEMSEMLIEAGEPIRVEDFDEIVRNRDTSILERYIEAGAQITRKSLSQALHSCNDNKFAVILAAGLEQGIDQKTLYESMKTAIYVHSKPSFDLLREAGVVLDKEMHSWAKSTLENIADYPERHPRRKELVAIYKECCEAIGVEPKGKLCRFRKQPEHVVQVLDFA